MIHGPSRYAVIVMQSLLSKPNTVYRIAEETGLSERTVKSQITELRKHEAVKVKKFIASGKKRGGPFAIYEPVVMEIT